MLFQGLVLVAATVTFSIQIGQAKYGKINKYLIDNVDSNSVVANLDAAASWLKSANSLSTPTKDLKQFVTLKQLVGNSDCDERSRKIMANNVNAIDLFHTMQNVELIRRVDRVVQDVFLEQAQRCHNVYMARYKSRSRAADATRIKKAQIFADKVIYETLYEQLYTYSDCKFPSAKILSEEFIVPRISIDNFSGHFKCPYKALTAILANDPDSKFLTPVPDAISGKKVLFNKVKYLETKLDSLVEEHLMAPCRYFVEQFGPNLFDIADLYKKFFIIEERDRDFYFDWATFRICKLFSKYKSMLSKDLRMVVKDPVLLYKIETPPSAKPPSKFVGCTRCLNQVYGGVQEGLLEIKAYIA